MKQETASEIRNIKSVIVLGVGNRLMEDDSIGVRIVEALGRENQSKKVRYAAGETDTDFCMRELSEADTCIIVDGGCTGNDPGSANVIDLKEVFARIRPARSFHDFDLIHAMQRENRIMDGILITIEVSSVSFSTELSPILRDRFDALVREVRLMINSYMRVIGINPD